MPLIERGRIVADAWQAVADDEPLPADRPALISAERLLALPEDAGRTAPLGVIWPNARPVSELAPHLGRLALVALVFPTFRDGRAYSQARLLRERYGFRGTLRATGQVLRDQFRFLVRVGFDALEARKEADAHAFAQSLAAYSVDYQPVAAGDAAVLQVRRRGPIRGAAHIVDAIRADAAE
jgi:uncharacterized protein (DUF934 family)